MKFSIITFGCKVNSYESEFMKEQLIKKGYSYNEDYKNSDIVKEQLNNMSSWTIKTNC